MGKTKAVKRKKKEKNICETSKCEEEEQLQKFKYYGIKKPTPGEMRREYKLVKKGNWVKHLSPGNLVKQKKGDKKDTDIGVLCEM